MIQVLCNRKVNATIASSITDWSNLQNFITDVWTISQPCSKMLLFCQFGGVKYNCSELFHPIITDSGMCCVFNVVTPNFVYKARGNVKCDAAKCPLPNGTVAVDWSPERGYPAVLPESYSPMHAAGTGESLGLKLMLDVERDSYYCSSTNSVGFKILLHNPLEVPNMREIGLLLSPGHETKVRIRASKTESTQHLRSLNKESRACLFEGEYVLHNYKTYTQSNCMEECFKKILLRYCGCITHYMFDIYRNASICSIYEASCVERVRLQSMVSRNGRGCANTCWPACYDLTYCPDFFITPLSASGFHTKHQLEKSKDTFYMLQNMAVVNIYFKENWYRSSKQAEYVGITEFLSNIGGVIGLFFGFSFISVAEIIFYLLLKPVRMLIILLWSKRTKSAKVRKLQNLKLFEKQSMND
ncbi:PREDICTED: pickpocket protein 28-like isoform X1 [Rhagoletis zephyria]|uniref:pickpocket protein 28-like isoform X1 n=1 Tax=Rhagoletis zephyria TaxID=28612 RepID=UPI000811485D|nr:PREDICTED: pickpocket protein 28-like isoform X1 [Rhagoletis zephyria]